MINKHEIPILEFDDNPQAVIMPTHEDLGLDLPPRCWRICLCHQSLSCFCHELQREGNLFGSSSSWLSCSCTIYGLANWLWRKANHINWNLWRLGWHARECFFDSDESFARWRCKLPLCCAISLYRHEWKSSWSHWENFKAKENPL